MTTPSPDYKVEVVKAPTGEIYILVTRIKDGQQTEIVITDNDFGGPVNG